MRASKRVEHHDRVIGLVADYCGLLNEAAVMLATLADAPADERADEFDALVGVRAESRSTYADLVHALSEAAAHGVAADLSTQRETAAAVRALLDRIVETGTVLAAWNADSVPGEVRKRCRQLEAASTSLARRCGAHDGPTAVAHSLAVVQRGIEAVAESLADGPALGRAQVERAAG